jgi:hypothetical protein
MHHLVVERMMPKFTVIDGPGRKDHQYHLARANLRSLIIEILRALVRGDDNHNRVGAYLVHVNNLLRETATPTDTIVGEVIAEMNEDISRRGSPGDARAGLEDIVLASLPVGAEACATDDFAKGRSSQRRTELRSLIEQWIIDHERGARANGWSYLKNIERTHFPPELEPAKRKPKRRSKWDDAEA